MTLRYAWVVEQLKSALAGDSRFSLLEGRLSEAEYDAAFNDADLTVLTYHPGVYGRKTSGVCWDTINNGLAAVVVERTWHALEFDRYKHPMVLAESFSPESVVEAIQRALEGLEEMKVRAIESRKLFAEMNAPEFYVRALASIDP
jgi:hypothetical protein